MPTLLSLSNSQAIRILLCTGWQCPLNSRFCSLFSYKSLLHAWSARQPPAGRTFKQNFSKQIYSTDIANLYSSTRQSHFSAANPTPSLRSLQTVRQALCLWALGNDLREKESLGVGSKDKYVPRSAGSVEYIGLEVCCSNFLLAGGPQLSCPLPKHRDL